MADLRGFDASQVEPSAALEPIPSGKYVAVISESEMKATKNNTGKYLELTFQVIEGQYKNRLLWARLNLENNNSQAVQIARAELSAICRAVGVLAPNDSVDVHNLPLVVQVKCSKRDDTGELGNEIKGYSKKEAPAPGNAASTTAASTNRAPPWKRTA